MSPTFFVSPMLHISSRHDGYHRLVTRAPSLLPQLWKVLLLNCVNIAPMCSTIRQSKIARKRRVPYVPWLEYARGTRANRAIKESLGGSIGRRSLMAL